MVEQRLTAREVLARYPTLGEDRLRYLRKWGLVSPQSRGYGFGDLAVLRQVHAALEAGQPFRGIVRALVAERQGQLSLDFQAAGAPAKVILLTPRPPATASPAPAVSPVPLDPEAQRLFLAASALDTGDESTLDEAVALYRRALARDPDLVPALINLGNAYYTRGQLIEAQALYERAISVSLDYYEAYFNLGNVLHDLGRYEEACLAYRDTLAVNPGCADAHFYLAVTLEQMSRSGDARAHWRAYQELAPHGEWVELAREFSE